MRVVAMAIALMFPSAAADRMAEGGQQKASKPHILHLMADDTGWNDLGYKNKLIDSPNLDRLASEGIQLTRHHAFKVCSPTRSSFHTGRYAFSMGLYDNSAEAVPWIKVVDQAVSQNFTLLPELLKGQGYATHAVGKWHLGYTTKKYTPTERGYDTFFGYYSAMTEDYWEHTHSVASNCELGPHSRDLHDSSSLTGLRPGTDNGTYEATLFGSRAVQIIDAHGEMRADQPFFMYLAFHNEHDPHQAPLSALSDDAVGHIRTDVYKVTAALIKTMDVQVGLVLDSLNRSKMLPNTVIGFSSDNGGPLDHANNAPFRGGKHTFWEGGVRTEAFVWSPLLPAKRHSSQWSGLMHVADWFYTYAVGVAGADVEAARAAGPYPDDAVSVWAALMADDPATPSPRAEVVHMVHSQYYPGNCTMSCWGGRNCPAVITVGDMKLMMGYVGDPRIVPLNFTAGVDQRGTDSPVAWGASGGHCGVAPPLTGLRSADTSTRTRTRTDLDPDLDLDDAPDPNCARGVLSRVDNVTCCAASCGTCGGKHCGSNPGGDRNCCRERVDEQRRSCDVVGPPCKEGPAPGPAPPTPGPFSERCTAPGLKGKGPITPSGLCVDGCLFNVTSDPTESNNLYNDPAFGTVVTKLKARLAVLGAAAPPWGVVPEVQHMSPTDFNKAKCDAAMRFGALAPIDV